MKLLVIGLGSMGKRRIRLLQRYDQVDLEIAGLDTNPDRRTDVERLYGIITYSDLDEAVRVEAPYGVIVCTSPSTHAEIILTCLNYRLHVFTEINLLKDRYHEIINTAAEYNLHLFLSSTPLYRKEIQYIHDEVQCGNCKVHYRYHVGQYLPDWHPWESYQNFFVGHRETNGCRELFAIELPWIIKTFGKIVGYQVEKDKISSLQIDYPDSYLVLLEHENGHKGTLHVDVVSRKPVRSLELYSEEMHLFWEGTPNSLSKYDIATKQMQTVETYSQVDRDLNYAENIIENAYIDELDVFIRKLLGKGNDERYTFAEDLYTLDFIDMLEGGQG